MWEKEGFIRQSLYAFEMLGEREEVGLQLGQNLQQQNHILASSLLLQGASELLEMPTDSHCHLLAGPQQPWGPEQGIQPGSLLNQGLGGKPSYSQSHDQLGS